MANYCSNYIAIQGNKEDINTLHERIEKSLDNDFVCFTKLLQKDEIKDYYTELGTRWFCVDLDKTDEETLTITGDSAWSPALPLFTTLSKEFPKLHIEYDYEEGGCDFGGWAEISNGECNDNCFKYWEYHSIRDYHLFIMKVFEDELPDVIETSYEPEGTAFFQYLKEDDKKKFLENYQAEIKTRA